MITNPHGWRARYGAALVRKQMAEERSVVNKLRQRHYDGDVEQVSVDSLADAQIAALAEDLSKSNEQLEQALKDPDQMTNAELREALSHLEVPKTAGRGRMIELYNEHIRKAK